MRLVAWSPDDLLRRLDDVVAVYGEAMGYRQELLQTRRGYIGAHVRRQGFRAVATLTTEGRLAGFGYGYTSGPGQWWHDQVRSALDESSREHWLSDCFEVVELHVRPGAQGHGVGARQLRALLAMADGKTVLLSTPEADEQKSRAWRLYRRFGVVGVVPGVIFPPGGGGVAVLGPGVPLGPRAAAGLPG